MMSQRDAGITSAFLLSCRKRPSWQPSSEVFEMAIDDYRISTKRCDVSTLDISRLLFFDAKSRLFHISYFCAV
jgi:hypothetical protein